MKYLTSAILNTQFKYTTSKHQNATTLNVYLDMN